MKYFATSFVLMTTFLGFFLVNSLAVVAQQLAVESDPSSAQVESEVASKLAEQIEQMREHWNVPGLAVAVVRNDDIVLNQGFGVLVDASSTSDTSGPTPVDDQSLFAIASNSKAFTTAAIALLVEDGKLSWDDRVREYLPWFMLNDPIASRDMRIRDLVCHRSGLGTFSGDLLWWGTSYDVRDVLDRIKHLPPASSFREEYGYSNLMFLAAGEVIAVVSGESWQEFVRKNILQPVDMRRTVLSTNDLETLTNVASPHKTKLDRNIPIAWQNWDTMAAAGGVISCSGDMAKWMQVQLRRGKLDSGDELFSFEQSAEMWAAQTPMRVSENRNERLSKTHFRAYGLGWVLSDYAGRKTVSHGGGYDGMYSKVLLVPEEGIGIVVLTNSMTSITSAITDLALDTMLGISTADWQAKHVEQHERFIESRKTFERRVQQATTSVKNGTTLSHSLTDYTGDFRCPLYGDISVGMESGQLVIRFLPAPELVGKLTHLHFDTFKIEWLNEAAWFDGGSATFHTNGRGVVDEIEFDVPNDDLWFYELHPRRVTSDAEEG